MNSQEKHATAKFKEWDNRRQKSEREIKRLEKELLDGSLTLFLQGVHRIKNDLIAQRSELSRCEHWVSHWRYKLQETASA